jgi:hypothetical protein
MDLADVLLLDENVDDILGDRLKSDHAMPSDASNLA